MLKIYLFILCAIIFSISAETSSQDNNKSHDLLLSLGTGKNVYQSKEYNELKPQISNNNKVRRSLNSRPCKGRVPPKALSEAEHDISDNISNHVKTTPSFIYKNAASSQLTPDDSNENLLQYSDYLVELNLKANSMQDSNDYDDEKGLSSRLLPIDLTKAVHEKSLKHEKDVTSKLDDLNADSYKDSNNYKIYKPLENNFQGYLDKYKKKDGNNFPNTDSFQGSPSTSYKVYHTPGNELSRVKLPKVKKGQPVLYKNQGNMNNINRNDNLVQGTVQEHHPLSNDLTPLDLTKLIQGQQTEPSHKGDYIYDKRNDDSVQDTNVYQEYQTHRGKPSQQSGPSYKVDDIYVTPNANSVHDSNVYEEYQSHRNKPSSFDLTRANKGEPVIYSNEGVDDSSSQLRYVTNDAVNGAKDKLSSHDGTMGKQEHNEDSDVEQDESQNENDEEEYEKNIENGSNSEKCAKKNKNYLKSQSAISGNRRMNDGANSDDTQLDNLDDEANNEDLDVNGNYYNYQGSSKKGKAISNNELSENQVNKKALSLDNISLLRNQLIDPAKGPGVISLAERRLLLSNAPYVTCYACSTISNPTCLQPDRRTTAKYCSKEHDACIKKIYQAGDDTIIVRDCASSCNDAALGALAPKYKNCEICHEDLCNGVLNLQTTSLILVISVMFIKYAL